MALKSTMATKFSKDGKYCAQLSTDGKLKVWETVTSTFIQEFTPDFHLTSPCVCLQFIQRDVHGNTNHSPRKKKRRESTGDTTPQIALGTNSGLLLLYSITKGDLECTIDSKISQPINCMSVNEESILYSALNQNIVSWNLDKRTIESKWKIGNETITAILAVPKRKILTASRNIKLWDIEKQELLKTFTGHSNKVSILEYIHPNSTSDAYVISGSMGDRLLSVWNLNEELQEKNAVASFLMEDVPSNVSIRSNATSHLAAVTRSGVLHFYQHTLNGKCTKPLKPKTTIQVVSDSNQSNTMVVPIPITAAFLKDDTVQVAYGNEIVLLFEDIIVNEYEKVQCLIRQDPRTRNEAKDKKIKKTQTPITDNNVHYVTANAITPTTSKRKSEGKREVPMEQRLENLTLNKLDINSKVPKVNNVAQLLIQGLHSKDKTILRNVLNQKDEQVIKNTIKRLPVAVLTPLIQEITILIQAKTHLSRTGHLWLKNLLQIHAGLLISNPQLSEMLAPILGSIENRLSLLLPLNKLRGRLDLLVSQVEDNSKQKDDQEVLLIYDDKESSSSEDEDMDGAAQSESDNEWMEESSEDNAESNEQSDSDDGDVKMD